MSTSNHPMCDEHEEGEKVPVAAMGQCMSRKTATFAASAFLQAVSAHQERIWSPEDESKPAIKKAVPRGATTSFGFRKARSSASQNLQNANIIAPEVIGLDSNGNAGDDKVVSLSTAPTTHLNGRVGVTHRLPPPKKEAKATTKVSRFGFRQANANRLNRVSDANVHPPTRIQYASNNNGDGGKEREKIESEIKAKVEMQERQLATDSNRNRHVTKFTLQPKPVQIKLLDSKNAKTLANNNRKRFVCSASSASTTGTSGDESSTMTEDSGVGLKDSRTARTTFDVVLGGSNRFDVRDRPATALPTLPGLSGLPTLRPANASNFGFVRNRAMNYQQNVIEKREQQQQFIKKTSPIRAVEDKSYKRNEKIAQFIKQKPSSSLTDASSSDEQIWSSNAGEAMAEMSLMGTNSSREASKENTVASLITAKARNRLSLVDPKFAAIADASNAAAILIEDEPTPVDSISEGNSGSNEKIKQISTTEKEKNTASSPGSPTNASNSLSLTDDRDDFLIDDEIADQPALLCDETLVNSSEVTATPAAVVNASSTPKSGRRHFNKMLEGSPLAIRNKALLLARTTSVDTLSPCESIASDDCMLDYELSSSMEDSNEKTETNDCTIVQTRGDDFKAADLMRDAILKGTEVERSSPKRLSLRSTLLKTREAIPSSLVPDSPRSDRLKKSSRATRSSAAGYESDDSIICIDRSQHYAIQQDVIGIKTLLLKLKRVLHEPSAEDYLLTSETHNSLADNEFFGGFGSDTDREGSERSNEELINLRRQVEYLQGQLEDTERVTQRLRAELTFLRSTESAPASVMLQTNMCNAATQTERVRPISAGPLLLQGTSNVNDNPGSLVSSNDSVKAYSEKPTSLCSSATNTSGYYSNAKGPGTSPVKLWRMPGDPATSTSISRRSCSRSRISNSDPITASSSSSVI